MLDPIFIQNMLQRGEEAVQKVNTQFSALTPTQLNWKPNLKSWSIAQCLDHLIVSNSSYFSVFEAIASGRFTMGFWQKFSPFNSLNMYILKGTMQEEVKIKLKTHPKFESVVSNVSGEIIEEYDANVKTLTGFIARCNSIDLDKTIIRSPAISIVTYSLRDVFWLLTQHQHRHINQGIRVKANENFPT